MQRSVRRSTPDDTLRDLGAFVRTGGAVLLVDVAITHLEMTSREQLRGRLVSRAEVAVARIDPPRPELNRHYYVEVGRRWYWMDRLPWTTEQWVDYAGQPSLETWELTSANQPAGYFELDKSQPENFQIAYFGLIDAFTGLGLGGHLLTVAVERAWDLGAKRVWLHTCTLDHPHALAHYLARGFRPFHREVVRKEIPDDPTRPSECAESGQSAASAT